ncbi:MAG: response regulator [Porcipelethomonas sp.]
MTLSYNIYFEVAAMVFLCVLIAHIILHYDTKRMNRFFLKLAVCLFAVVTLDVGTAITISYASVIPVWLNTLLNFIYFSLDVLLEYMFTIYCLMCTYKEVKKGFVLYFTRIACVISMVVLLVNFKTGWVFSFSSTNGYVHGPLYYLVYIMPIFFTMLNCILMLSHINNFNKKQKISIVAYTVVIFSGPVVQIVFSDILFILFSISVGFMLLMFSIQVPDYKEMSKTMDDLNHTRDDAEEAMKLAQSASKAKTDFLSSMSHEIRTPINAILGFNDMIMKKTHEARITEYSLNVQAAGKSLLSTITNILDFIDIENNKLKIENADYSSVMMLEDVISYAEYNAGKKKLELKIKIDENIPVGLHGDMNKLIQIFSNLISNAVKYTNEGCVEIDVSWKPQDEGQGYLSALIKDSGIGMTKEDIALITSMFQRVDKKRTYNIQGVGIGLSIVTRLLEMMDSHLEIESEYEKGTTVSFSVLQKVSDNAPVGDMAANNRAGSVRGRNDDENKFTSPNAKVLYVDDNQMNLDLFRICLSETEMVIDTAVNGLEALALLEKKKYDVIFLDHMMPVMDGLETIKIIKERNLCAGVPIIVVTANAVIGEKEKYLEAGFDDYLSKPVESVKLRDTLLKYLPKGLVKKGEGEKESENRQTEIHSPAAASVPGKSTMEQLRSFLDVKSALAYCCDSEDFYKEILGSYLSGDKSGDMQKFYDEKDYENYRITVHALKSTSLSIGANQLSEDAKNLEMAAKDGNIGYIDENHSTVLEEYKDVLGKIDDALNGRCETQISSADTGKNSSISENTHILIVDDDSMCLYIASRMLNNKFKVSTANSGEEALGFIGRCTPDLILLDIHMPSMDGFSVLRILRASPDYKKIPVIVLTADDDKNIESRCFNEGAMDFITKPFIADILIQRVNRIIELDLLQKQLIDEVDRQTKTAVESQKAFERLSVQVLKTLAETVDAKDKFTSGHSVRVAEYSREIARRCGKSEKEQDEIYYIGLLHDIGKIGISDEIINKTEKLSDEEHKIIKNHAASGSQILQNISEIPGIAIGARWHHERYDGLGYPDHLKGSNIPEIARILSVADAYDAMTSNRSYRKICTQEFVRSEIEKGKGKQFDPHFADIMLEMIDEDKEYRMRGAVKTA